MGSDRSEIVREKPEGKKVTGRAENKFERRLTARPRAALRCLLVIGIGMSLDITAFGAAPVIETTASREGPEQSVEIPRWFGSDKDNKLAR